MKRTLSCTVGGLLAVAAVGAVMMARQMLGGLGLTNLHEPVVWGLYVVGFAYFVGIGAGALTIAAFASASKGSRDSDLAVDASAVALAALVAAGLCITLDLGRPDRAWMLLTHAQPRSPLTMDFLIINALLLSAVVLLFFALRPALVRSGIFERIAFLRRIPVLARDAGTPRSVQAFSVLLIGLVPLLYVLTIRVFASLQARPSWHTPALGISSLVSALLAGTAAVSLISLMPVRRRGKPRASSERLRFVLVGLLVLDLILAVSPFLILRQWDSPPALAAMRHVGAAMYLEILLGLTLPLLLLAFGSRHRAGQLVAALLILGGVFVKRWHIIVPAMEERSLRLPAAHYAPNIHEWVILGGVFAIALLIVHGLVRLTSLPAWVADEAADLQSEGVPS